MFPNIKGGLIILIFNSIFKLVDTAIVVSHDPQFKIILICLITGLDATPQLILCLKQFALASRSLR